MPPILDIQELHYIIENNLITSVFQPIVDIKQNRLYGYEALSRGPKESHLYSPIELFNTACESNRLSELEYACRDAACKSYSVNNPEGKLFINVSPISLMEKGYEKGMTRWLLSHYNIAPERVVIELSEQYPLDDYQPLKKAFKHFREEGFEVALDDLGAGYAGLKTWSELRPDYVKIDRHFIDRIHEDPIKREFVRSIHEIALELNCQVIAEGVETSEELSLLYSLGIRYVQGYYLGRPCITPESEKLIQDRINTTQYRHHNTYRPSQTVAELSTKYPIIKPDWTLNRVIDFFHRNKSLRCLPVIDNEKPIGIIERQAILELITAKYGREIHGKKLVSEFMSCSSIIVDHNSPLEDVSHQLTATQHDHLQQDFIITKNNAYMGIGKTAALLQKITEQKIRYARYANPLTQLPGNVPIYEHIDQLIAEKKPFSVAYCDLNHFKPYNDHYGYSKGDDVLSSIASIFKDNIKSSEDFIGHVGGDDFIIIFRSHDWLEKCDTLLDLTTTAIKHFYSAQAIKEGGVWATSRQGEKQFFKFMTLAIGVVEPDLEYCDSHHDISELASDAKKQAKKLSDNQTFVSRRRRPNASFNEKKLIA